MHTVGDLLLLAGASWCVLAALGVLKFRDVFARLHAGTKSTTLGLLLVLAGSATHLGAADAAKLALAGLLVLLTAPVGAHLVGRAARLHPGPEGMRIDVRDELADEEG